MFSLLDEPWIKAVDAEGNQVVVGIRDVFDGSKEISLFKVILPPRTMRSRACCLRSFGGHIIPTRR